MKHLNAIAPQFKCFEPNGPFEIRQNITGELTLYGLTLGIAQMTWTVVRWHLDQLYTHPSIQIMEKYEILICPHKKWPHKVS